MYYSKKFNTVSECVEFCNENSYKIVTIVPVVFEKTSFDFLGARKYELVYK